MKPKIDIDDHVWQEFCRCARLHGFTPEEYLVRMVMAEIKALAMKEWRKSHETARLVGLGK